MSAGPPDQGPPPAAEAPPPELKARAPRPRAVRLRKSVVQALALGGVVLVSGSLAWAFVVQPELREAGQARAADARADQTRRAVQPTDVVTDQPASYDRLPPPRTRASDQTAEVAGREGTPTSTATAGVRRPAPRSHGPVAESPGRAAARSGLFFPELRSPSAAQRAAETPPRDETRGAITPSEGDYADTYNPHRLSAPLSPYELKAGAMVPAALLTAVDTSRAGPVVAVVSQNIFDSVTGRHLLLPQGTRLIGRAGGDSAWGDRRAFLTWERIILPNGKSMVLGGGEKAVDAQGAVGVTGQADRRLFSLAVGTLFAGAITALGQAARDGDRDGGGLLGDAGDAAAIEGARVGGRLIDREIEVRPVIRLRPGAAVRVMITRDLVLEPYEP